MSKCKFDLHLKVCEFRYNNRKKKIDDPQVYYHFYVTVNCMKRSRIRDSNSSSRDNAIAY